MAARALTAAVTAGALLALAAGPARASDEGRYGVQDPTFDGVYRQALSLLALDAAGTRPAEAAVAWLLDQQCGDGSWTAYRADVSVPCAAGTGDSNATAASVQALAALDREPLHDALGWLRSIQNTDGGFPYAADGGSDANSTALVLGAFAAEGVDPATVLSGSGASGFDALGGLQLGCDADPATRGAFDYATVDFSGSPKAALEPNDFATVQAVPGVLGLPIGSPAATAPVAAVPECPAGPTAITERAAWGAEYLHRSLTSNPDGPFLPSVFGPGADYGSTAGAVVALAATGVHPQTATAAAAWLADNAVASWVPDPDGADRPAALAGLILAAEATGMDPSDIAGENLVARLAATGPQPDAATQAGASGQAQAASSETGTTGGSSAGSAKGSEEGSAAPTTTAVPPTLPDTGAAGEVLAVAGLAGAALIALGTGVLRAGRRS